MRLRPDDYLKITDLHATLRKFGIDFPRLEEFNPHLLDKREI